MAKTNDVYQIITDQILDLLNKGIVPWRKPWNCSGESYMTRPMNLISKKPYRGINVFILAAAGYNSPYWLTYKQAQEAGGNVRQGEKSTLIVFWKFLQVEDENNPDRTKKVPMLRYYRVFNVEQCEGISYPTAWNANDDPYYWLYDVPVHTNTIPACDKIMDGYTDCPPITYGGNRAYYSPGDDRMQIPNRIDFTNVEDFYCTVFHEMIHSTGHVSRLGRLEKRKNKMAAFGSYDYGVEELVAEMGAAFLCGEGNILPSVISNAAAYIDGWRRTIREDRKMVVTAAGAAERAVNYILTGKKEEYDN